MMMVMMIMTKTMKMMAPTSISILPRGLSLLSLDLLLNLRLLVDVVEVVHDDGNGERDTENSADGTNLFPKFTFTSSCCL